ncbi:MAG TPA: hypothetical protein VJ768_10505, partial [Anaerolineales bacterium]|nr:hypothetical protein [Anaerolineales bacterium]
MPSPRSINPSVPAPIERVILKSTAKNPDDRFASVAELNQAFQASLAHVMSPEKNPAPVIALAEPPEASPEAPLLAADDGRSARRRLARLAIAAVLLLLLLLACPVASTGILNILNAASNPVEGMTLPEETMDPMELTELAATIEALSTEAAGPTGVATVIQTVVVTDEPTETPTPTMTPTATVTGTLGTPTPTRTPTVGSNPQLPQPTKTPTKKPKTPTPNPTSPPSNPTTSPPTNPPPTNPPPTQQPTAPPYP